MDDLIITREKIDALVDVLPSFYQKELARTCFGKASASTRRKIKYWRSGNMADKVVEKNIYIAAQKLAEKHQAAAS